MATSSGEAESKRWAEANNARSRATLSGIWPDFGHTSEIRTNPDKVGLSPKISPRRPGAVPTDPNPAAPIRTCSR